VLHLSKDIRNVLSFQQHQECVDERESRFFMEGMTHRILQIRQLTKIDAPTLFINYSHHHHISNSVKLPASFTTMARNSRSVTKGYKGGQNSNSSKRPNQPKRPLTHFLCLPLVTETSKPQLEASLRKFRDSVATKYLDGLPADDAPLGFGQAPRAPLIPPKAIRPIGTIHFTLGVMSLESEEKVDEAVEHLQGLNLKTLATDGTVQTGEFYISYEPLDRAIIIAAIREFFFLLR
jgi:hypothetical protein